MVIVFGIWFDWVFFMGLFDVECIEIWYSKMLSCVDVVKLGDFVFFVNMYMMMGLVVGVQFFFWVCLVDKLGNIGVWYLSGLGVLGLSSLQVFDILGYFNGQIGKMQFGVDLLFVISSIELLMVGSSNDYVGDDYVFVGIVLM